MSYHYFYFTVSVLALVMSIVASVLLTCAFFAALYFVFEKRSHPNHLLGMDNVLYSNKLADQTVDADDI